MTTVTLPGVERDSAVPMTLGELVFDEELNAYRIKTTPLPTQRKPETGERLDGTAKAKPETPCYICHARHAVVHMGDSVPACGVCYDRYRRKE
jgi:hypothetical protein